MWLLPVVCSCRGSSNFSSLGPYGHKDDLCVRLQYTKHDQELCETTGFLIVLLSASQ